MRHTTNSNSSEDHAMSRRRFLIGMLCTPMLATGVIGCSSLEPEAFVLGEQALPPYGCKQLRKNHSEADC